MNSEYAKIIEKAKSKRKSIKETIKVIKKSKVKNLDVIFKNAHDDIFNNIDCLDCANCCKSLGPLFTETDISRISSYLKMKPAEFIKEYLMVDEDGDYIFNTMPCPFIDEKNLCFIYSVRPKACREYPHSNQKNMKNLLKLALKNISYCPAISIIIDKVKEEI